MTKELIYSKCSNNQKLKVLKTICNQLFQCIPESHIIISGIVKIHKGVMVSMKVGLTRTFRRLFIVSTPLSRPKCAMAFLTMKQRLKIFAVCFMLLSQFSSGAVAAPGALPGDQAPVFSLPALDGQKVQVDFVGKLTMLNFWAVRCPYCREEMPDLAAFAEAYRSRLVLYAIDIREPADRVQSYMSENRFILPVLLDKKGELSEKYAVEKIPTTLLIDARGNVVFRKTGVMSRFEMEMKIAGQQQ